MVGIFKSVAMILSYPYFSKSEYAVCDMINRPSEKETGIEVHSYSRSTEMTLKGI